MALLGPTLLQRGGEKRGELSERALRFRLVVHRAAFVWHGPAVECVVHFALVLTAPRGERGVELVDRRLRHRVVIRRVSEVKLCLHARQAQVWAGGTIDEQASTVE